MADLAPGVRVLIAEDSPTQAAMLRAILEEEDFRVGLSRDGREAAGLFDQEAFGIVLSDIVMPGMDGFALCRHIKVTNPQRSVPVILLTAMNDPMDIARGLEAGADDFIAKPYDPAELIAKIRKLLATAKDAGAAGGVRPDDRAQMIGLLVGAFEASARKGAELETRTAELADARHQLLAFSKPATAVNARPPEPDADGVFTVDRTGALTSISPGGARMLGWAPGELNGRSRDTIMPAVTGSPPGPGEASVAGVLGGGPGFERQEAVLLIRGGAGLPVVYSCMPMITAAAGLTGVVVTFRPRAGAHP